MPDFLYDSLWINARIITAEQNMLINERAAIAVSAGQIAWVGSMKELAKPPKQLANRVHDVHNKIMTPALIDCHTHLIYAGNRADEFDKRLHGASYEDIAKAGGGINSTVQATRAVSEEELLTIAVKRCKTMLANGVTTIEIKSGYGLDLATEIKILRVAKKLGQVLPVTIYKTFLGAHTTPAEYKNKADEYIKYVCDEMIPKVANEHLADAVDVFCENIAFNLEQTELVFQTAKKYGLAIKCHAEQLSRMRASSLAATYKALSVDHLEHAEKEEIKILAENKVTAVLLPGAFYFLREKKLPAIDLLREYKVPIAIATDCNPGTSPILSLPLIMNMACVLFRLTPEESFLGTTNNAARALGKLHERGTLTRGKVADFVIWNCQDINELCYYAGQSFVHRVIKNGVVIKV